MMPWKTSLVILVIDLLARKAIKVSLLFSLKRVKFLGNLILSMGTEKSIKEEKRKS